MQIRLAVCGFLGAVALLGQGGPLPGGSVNVSLPVNSPVDLVGFSYGDSRGTARGAALVLDLHISLQLRNVTSKSIHGITVRVVSQEVAPGGKTSLALPSLNVGPNEVFPVRIDRRLIRPTSLAVGPLVQVDLDGVLFQDLSFFGPDRLNSRRTMTAWEKEAQRDREYFKRVLAQSGKEGLHREMLESAARQSARPQWNAAVRTGAGRAVTNAALAEEREADFAFLEFPDSPVEPVKGSAFIAGSQVRTPDIEVRNRSDKHVRYVELGWVLSDQGGHSYMVGSLPSSGPAFYLPPGQNARVIQDSTVDLSHDGQPVLIQRKMTGFVSHVEFADGQVWVPNRKDLEDSLLRQVLEPSAEEQRLADLCIRKGVDALVEELKKF